MTDDSAPRRAVNGPPRVAEPVTPTMPLPTVPASGPPPSPTVPLPPQAPYAEPVPYAEAAPYAPAVVPVQPYMPYPAQPGVPAGELGATVAAESQAALVSRRAASNALGLLAVVNALFLLAVTVPEVVPWWGVLFDQLAPLVATPLATGGEELVPGQGPGLVQTLLLLAAFVAYVAAHRQGRYRLVGMGAAVATAVLAVVAGLMGLLVSGRSAAVGAALAGIVALLAARTANAMRTPVKARSDRIGTTFLWCYGLSVVVPLGIGRALFAPELVDAARGLASLGDMKLRFLAAGDIATLWLYLAGLSVGIVFWVVLQLLPPWRGRPLVRPIATALLVLAVGWVWIGSQASSSGEERARELLVEYPQIGGATPGAPSP